MSAAHPPLPALAADIIDAKQGPCRACGSAANNGRLHGLIEFRYVVPLEHPDSGEAVAANVVPLCPDCNREVAAGNVFVGAQLVAALTPDERAYALEHVGEEGLVRLYGSGPLPREGWWPQ